MLDAFARLELSVDLGRSGSCTDGRGSVKKENSKDMADMADMAILEEEPSVPLSKGRADFSSSFLFPLGVFDLTCCSGGVDRRLRRRRFGVALFGQRAPVASRVVLAGRRRSRAAVESRSLPRLGLLLVEARPLCGTALGVVHVRIHTGVGGVEFRGSVELLLWVCVMCGAGSFWEGEMD